MQYHLMGLHVTVERSCEISAYKTEYLIMSAVNIYIEGSKRIIGWFIDWFIEC